MLKIFTRFTQHTLQSLPENKILLITIYARKLIHYFICFKKSHFFRTKLEISGVSNITIPIAQLLQV